MFVVSKASSRLLCLHFYKNSREILLNGVLTIF